MIYRRLLIYLFFLTLISLALIQNTVFVGTSDGLYVLNSDIWEPVLADTSTAK